MAGGIPLAMLALHRLADAPSPGRGVVLGLALAAQALACAYYGIFAGLMVGYGVLFLAATPAPVARCRASGPPSRSRAVDVGLRRAAVLPARTSSIQRDEGFSRSLDDARATRRRWRATSPRRRTRIGWMLLLARRLGWRIGEVLFPGILAIALRHRGR